MNKSQKCKKFVTFLYYLLLWFTVGLLYMVASGVWKGLKTWYEIGCEYHLNFKEYYNTNKEESQD